MNLVKFKDNYFLLVNHGTEIVLRVCDEEGQEYIDGFVLCININKGTISRYPNLNGTFGISLDRFDKIRVSPS